MSPIIKTVLVDLTRVTGKHSDESIGVLSIDGVPRFLTLEPADFDNEPNISCIPAGTYNCRRVKNRTTTGGMKIPETFKVEGVSNRDGILFHVGNMSKDTEGCILLGTELGLFGDTVGVFNSKTAFKNFLRALEGVNEFILEVR